jgi:hypothetical protein
MRGSNFLLRSGNTLWGIVKENKGCTHLWRDYAHRAQVTVSREIDIENDSHSHSQLDTTHKRNTTYGNCNYLVCNNINDLRCEHGQ